MKDGGTTVIPDDEQPFIHMLECAGPVPMSKTMTTSSPHSPAVTAVILAGGRSRRMGGRDKAFLPLDGRAMIAHAIGTIRPQVHHLLINTHGENAAYAALGYPLIRDVVAGQPGPLAGLLSGLLKAPDPLVLSVPCDMPLLPADLVARLAAALEKSRGEVATVHDGTRLHQAILLAKRTLAPSVRAYLDQGERKVETWLTAQHYALADFSDCPEAFANANTPQELAQLEARLQSQHAH